MIIKVKHENIIYIHSMLTSTPGFKTPSNPTLRQEKLYRWTHIATQNEFLKESLYFTL